MKLSTLPRNLLWAIPLVGLMLLGATLSRPAPRPPVAVAGAWATIGPPGSRAAFAYMTISLTNGADDALLGAQTPIADSVDLLAPIGPPGHTELVSIADLPVHGKQPLILQARGAHFLLHGVTDWPPVGQSFPITLHFQMLGDVPASVTVYAAPPERGMPKLPKGVPLG